MAIKRFEEIVAWKKADILALTIYQIFKNGRDFGFKDQIQRAAVSVMNNLAEGFERRTNKEFIAFLYIAKGSSGEVRSMLYLAQQLKYLDQENFIKLGKLTVEISKLISGLIKTL